jgi:hypothetical protein
MANREEVGNSNVRGVFDDLWDIFVNEIKKAIHLVWPKYKYISDELIISTLSSRVKVSRSAKHLKEVHEHYHRIALSNFSEVRGDFGIVINQSRMYQLLAKYFPGHVFANPAVSPDTAALLNPTVKNVMKRFGRNAGPPDAETKRRMQEKMFREMVKVDTMNRIAEMHLQTKPQNQKTDFQADLQVKAVTLNVIVEKARNMPKVDLIRGADLFCVIFLEGSSELFQTEIRSGLSENDWTWEANLSQDFKWTMAESSELLNVERNVVVMVYDKDQLSEDDLIGCVLVQLGELENGHFDSWKRIIRPPNAPKREYLFFTAPTPELKLKITLSFTDLTQRQLSPEESIYTTGSPVLSPLYSEGRMQPAIHSDVVFCTRFQ